MSRGLIRSHPVCFGLFEIRNRNLIPGLLVSQVEDHAIAIAIFDRNSFGARRVRV